MRRGGAEPSEQSGIRFPKGQWATKGLKERDGRSDYFRVARHEKLKGLLWMEDVEKKFLSFFRFWLRFDLLALTSLVTHDQDHRCIEDPSICTIPRSSCSREA